MSSRPSLETWTFGAMGVIVRARAGYSELVAIDRLFRSWERVFSRFRRDSELNRVNQSPQPTLLVSELLARALRTGLDVARATGGLVDPTLGRAIVAAGYDRDFSLMADDDERPPGPPAPGRWQALRLCERLLSRPPGTLIDLNGVVKALAVDAALDLVRGDGFVSAGGDVAVRGGTTVGVPGDESLRLLGGGVATSGKTKRSWRRGGERQHHLIDPRTGRPAESRWSEVTVVAGSCLAADVAAKAAFLLSDEGPAWLDDRALAGRFVSDSGIVDSRRWRETLESGVVAA